MLKTGSVMSVIAFSKTDFRKASVETLDGGLRTSRPTSRWAFVCPVLVVLAVLSQPPSKTKIIDQETLTAAVRLDVKNRLGDVGHSIFKTDFRKASVETRSAAA
ncbi:hypothetical protein [Prosthecobacter sp.]|uniref:hypothetical protein n=1 Tax=Prosthecobacter sp. TaxID=1965333 RepID=UPI003784718F